MIKRSRNRNLAYFSAYCVAGFLYVIAIGDTAMARQDVDFGWEWRAGRALSQKVGLQIESITKEKTGFFGISNSPSLGGSMPEPMLISGNIVAIDRKGPVAVGQNIVFRIPKMEVLDLRNGDLIAVGIIEEKIVCHSPAREAGSSGDVTEWLKDAPCE